jgi:hypothetical protein
MSTHYLILDEEKLDVNIRNNKTTFEEVVSHYIEEGWHPIGGGIRTNGLDRFGYRAWNWAHLYR